MIDIVLVCLFQLVDMTPSELQWLSSHLGHDVGTHTKNYRLHANHIEVTKVGKILTALDSGKSVSGQRLNSLLEGNFPCLVTLYLVIVTASRCSIMIAIR